MVFTSFSMEEATEVAVTRILRDSGKIGLYMDIHGHSLILSGVSRNGSTKAILFANLMEIVTRNPC